MAELVEDRGQQNLNSSLVTCLTSCLLSLLGGESGNRGIGNDWNDEHLKL